MSDQAKSYIFSLTFRPTRKESNTLKRLVIKGNHSTPQEVISELLAERAVWEDNEPLLGGLPGD